MNITSYAPQMTIEESLRNRSDARNRTAAKSPYTS